MAETWKPMPRRGRAVHRALDLLIVGTAALAMLAYATDGIDFALAGVRVRVNSAGRPLLALMAAVVARVWAGPTSGGLGHAWEDAASRVPRLILVALLVAMGFSYWHYRVRDCGGLDSHGYVSASALIASGRLKSPQRIATLLPFPERARAAAPLGYVVGADGESRVPRFPLGLPVVMAAFRVFGPTGPFAVSFVMAIIALALAFAIAARTGDALSGIFAATIVGLSPTFADAAIQPMSDVPATCWVLAATWFALIGRPRPIAAGACAGMAVLTRPALLPAAAALALMLAARWLVDLRRVPGEAGPSNAPRVGASDGGDSHARSWLGRAASTEAAATMGDAGRFVAVLAAFLAVQATLNAIMYGRPFSSGYGPAGHMFSVARVGTNAATFASWITYSHTPAFWMAWVAGLGILRRERWTAALSLVAVVVALPYLPYITFDDWEATRFLLPGLALVIIVGVRGLDVASSVVGGRTWRPVLLLAIAVAAATASHAFLRRSDVFLLAQREAKYRLVGEWFRDHTRQETVVISALHSGSILYYSGRETVRWDAIPPGSLEPTVKSLADRGHPVFLALDMPSEGDPFVERFRAELPQLAMVPSAHLAQANIFELRATRDLHVSAGAARR